MGDWTNSASRILTAGAGSSKKGNISSTTERATSTRTTADISSTAAAPLKRRHKTFSEQNKQFDPDGRREKAPPWNAAVTLLFFFWGKLGGSLLCIVFCRCFVCVLFPKLFFFSGDDFSAKLQDIRGDVDQAAEVRNRRASIFSSITLLKMARTNNTRFGCSANALG